MDFELTEEHRMIKESAREFAEKEIRPAGLKYEEEGRFPFEVFRKAAKLGFIGASIPEEYNGAGLDLLADVLILEEFSRADSSIGACMMSVTLGCPMVREFGSRELKERYLAKVPAGEAVSAIAVTEPDAGSDVAAIKTTAVKDGDEWVLNGTKQFITNGNIADWVVVLAKTDPSVQPAYKGITAFLVETRSDGYSASKLKTMGMHCYDHAEVNLSGVRVPNSHIVGELNRGFYQLMRFFNESRITVGAVALGIAQGAFERALDYARKRKTFGKPLVEHQAIQFKLADMAKEIEAARLLLYKAAWSVSRGKPDPYLSSMAKLAASEAAVHVAYEAVQIHGGYGYCKEYDVERYYRDARAQTIYEGTSEIQRMIIARRILGKL
ncbi:MAG: acyl-CoA dehydrogenase family protein [Candidatus Nezhaarchaeales archaeon]